jgi:DNA-binding NtrC family response regulator
MGYQVRTTGSGFEALRWLGEEPYDLLVLDEAHCDSGVLIVPPDVPLQLQAAIDRVPPTA